MVRGIVLALTMGAVAAVPLAQQNMPVRTIAAGQRLATNAGVKGATYYSLESQTTRLTTRFGDAVAVAERGLDGHFQTRLTDLSGNEVARFKVGRIDGATSALQYFSAADKVMQAYSEPSVQPTLDWANQQAYSLWRDRIDSGGTQLEWQGTLMRPKGSTGRNVEHEILELETEWANGLTAKTVRRSSPQHQPLPGRTVRGDVLVSRLTKNGVEVGVSNWFVQQQILMWQFPGLTKGYLAPEHLKGFGGWPFTPDMAWLNLQTIAFQHFKTQIDKDRFIARTQPRWFDRVSQFLMPTVSADESGCDGLHWLDSTIFRYCCDVHDLCYSKNGCNYKSWWQVWTSWSCDYCNMWVVDCFVDGGVDWSNIGMSK